MKTEHAIGLGLVALVVLLAASGKAAASDGDVHPTIVRALQVENDPAILRTFAVKLRAAGFASEAALVDARALDIMPITERPDVVQVTQQGGATLSLRQAMGQ